MNRAVEDTVNTEYDVLVIGGGIYGACVARDAALRGLHVVLLEKGDFGHATSSNSHKIIHGGLRYLQHGNFPRMRESIQERRTLVRIAPHLVKPMPFLIPTYQHIGAKKFLLRLALLANDIIACDRNRDLPKSAHFPASRIMSNKQSLAHCSVMNQSKLTGGAYYYDAQVHNSERLLLSMLQSAHGEGATILNYVNVTQLLVSYGSVIGVCAEDMLTHAQMEIRAKCVVNCGGPWVARLGALSSSASVPFHVPLLKAVVLVTDSIVDRVALGVPSTHSYVDADAVMNKGCRYFFITPWRNRSLVGTFQSRYDGNPDDLCVTEKEIEAHIKEVNESLPGVKLTRSDVHLVNCGLLPRNEIADVTADVQLAKHSVIYDHETMGDVKGMVSVNGVKFTTARAVAEKAVDLVCQKLGKKGVPCTTATVPVYGGDMTCHDDVLQQAMAQKPGNLSQESVQHIVATYGSQFSKIFQYCLDGTKLSSPITTDVPTIQAEVVHSVRKEMAQTLSDVVFRRTELGTVGYPGSKCLQQCVTLMAQEMKWDESRVQRELYETNEEYERRGASPCMRN
ncbi:MAG: FAD-dependent oxidoreductase [Nitrospirales bacterium]|nr:MAG: FAD-dependent oxidoreductase [Nitrospirales bacterium]